MSQAYVTAPYIAAPEGFKALYVTPESEDVVERTVVGFKVLDDLSVIPVTVGSRPNGSILGTLLPDGTVESTRFGTHASADEFIAAAHAKFKEDRLKADAKAAADAAAALQKTIDDAKARVADQRARQERANKAKDDDAALEQENKRRFDRLTDEAQGIFPNRSYSDNG
jgi:hypothetical protein